MAYKIKSYLVTNQTALEIPPAKGGATINLRAATADDLKRLKNN